MTICGDYLLLQWIEKLKFNMMLSIQSINNGSCVYYATRNINTNTDRMLFVNYTFL